MFTVRYPSGVAVQYNTACYLLRGNDGWQLYTKNPTEGGTWVASIQLSAGAVVEAVGACRVGNDAGGRTDEEALRRVVAHLPRLAQAFPTVVRQLKRGLRGFDATRQEWKG